MKKIYVLEHFDFTREQRARLDALGEVKYYEKAIDHDIAEAIREADAILIDWIDPDTILPKLHKGQFICLPYTGYDWVKNLGMAKDNGVVISNTPNYSTNAVAEHHIALLLDVAKHITEFNNEYKATGKTSFNRGFELASKRVGIIGLGNIGYRLATLIKPFTSDIVTYNRTKKNVDGILDLTLDELLTTSDVVCVTCRLNDKTKNLISTRELDIMKRGAILTSTTGEVIDLDALDIALDRGTLFGAGIDDVDKCIVPSTLVEKPNFICTYHRAYDTNESENNRINLCIDSIEAFLNGSPINKI